MVGLYGRKVTMKQQVRVKTYTSTDVDPQTISGQGVAKNNSDSVIDSAIADKKHTGKVDCFCIL